MGIKLVKEDGTVVSLSSEDSRIVLNLLNRNRLYDSSHPIKQWRDRHDVTQAQLAKLSKISAITLSCIETGKTKFPSMKTAMKLSKAMSVTVEYLMNSLETFHNKNNVN